RRIKGVLKGLCGRCYAVTETGRSPHADALPFHTFGDSKLYDEDFGHTCRAVCRPFTPTCRPSISTGGTLKRRSAISARFRHARNSRRCLRLPLPELPPLCIVGKVAASYFSAQ